MPKAQDGRVEQAGDQTRKGRVVAARNAIRFIFGDIVISLYPVKFCYTVSDAVRGGLIVAGIAVVFVADVLLPLGVAVWSLYMLPLLLTILIRNRNWMIGSAVATTALIGAGFWLSPSGVSLKYAVGNRVLGIVLVWAVTGLLLRYQQIQQERETLMRQLREAMARIKTLRGMLAVCTSCRRVQSDGGDWSQFEDLIHAHSEAEIHHSLCPPCAEQFFPGFVKRWNLLH